MDPQPRVGGPAHDFRVPLLGVAGWAGGLLSHLVGMPGLLGLVPVALGAAWLVPAVRGWSAPITRTWRRWVAALLLVALTVGAGALLRHRAVDTEPVRGWAEDRASATVVATVTSDPRTIEGAWGDQVVVRVRAEQIEARGSTVRLGAPVLVLGDPSWAEVRLGATVRTRGRLGVADDPALAALLTGAAPPETVRGADVWWRASERLRASVREAVDHRPLAQRALVPALVDGDDGELPAEVEQQFQTTGLTHLTAVSGTNLTLVVGCLLLGARALGVRGRWLHLIGVLGIAAFILLARTEPSVLRAAAMGTVGLFALGTDGRRRGLRALGVAVVGLLLIAPGLAVAAGFALSVLATAGIVLLVPRLQGALGRWMPPPLAAAIAVPLAAQLACTPVVAALSGEVSLVAVVANLLVGPAVGPATVLGLAGGLVGLFWPWAGALVGTLAAWCVGWIVTVARHGAGLPQASVGWGSGVGAIASLTLLCLVLAVLLPVALRSRRVGPVLVAGSLVAVVGVPGCSVTSLGSWPPDDWVVAACDVGQGDAVVIAAGPGAGIVVDAGPEPTATRRCLDTLGVRQVPLVVLTHLHADHVDGLEGVLAGRQVGAIETTAVLDPPAAAEEVVSAARRAGVGVGLAAYGSVRRIGAARVQVLAPTLTEPVPGAGDGSTANDASVVLLVEVAGLRVLLTGDLEPPGQGDLAARVPELDVDVLKVPHHGSRHQDMDWLASLDAEVALVTVGDDNDYGHPAPLTLDVLREAGAEVYRTDTDGAIAVSSVEGEPQVRTEE